MIKKVIEITYDEDNDSFAMSSIGLKNYTVDSLYRVLGELLVSFDSIYSAIGVRRKGDDK